MSEGQKTASQWLTPGGCMEAVGPTEMECTAHGKYMATGTVLRLRTIWTGCPECEREREEQMQREREELEAKRKAERLEARLEACSIPPRFRDKTFANFVADTQAKRQALETVRAYGDNFAANREGGRGLVLAGKPGTGKTHLASALLLSVLADFNGRYVTCGDFIRKIRATWRKDADQSEEQVLDEYGRVSLLVLDEIGVAFGTEGEQKHLFDLLDKRYREIRPTIILTNEDAKGLKQFIGERVYDRLTETCEWVSFDWASYRRTAAREAA